MLHLSESSWEKKKPQAIFGSIKLPFCAQHPDLFSNLQFLVFHLD